MKKPTLAVAKRMIKKANPSLKNLRVYWNHKPTYCPMLGDLGKFYWSSVVVVSADGYKLKNMVLTTDNDGTWIK